MSKLSILGGPKTITKKMKLHNSIGNEERNIVNKVMKSGKLSAFYGTWGDGFYGGKYVQKFERDCSNFFKVKYALSVNSWTSGLIASVGALDINPGDEIIVSPWSMCASATAIIHWNAIPIFADIEYDTYNLDPADVIRKITKRTKAIMSVDIFGHSAPINELKKIARKYNLKIISDSAQSPGAKYNNKFAGTATDIGGISLNYHKHINTGEGGVIFTNNRKYAERIAMIRNHAEAIVVKKKVKNLANLVGYNFRMGEIEAAIGIEQLKKLKKIIKKKQDTAKLLINGLKGLSGLKLPIIKKNCSHVFYVFPLQVDGKKLGVHRNRIYEALQAEGVEGLLANFTHIPRLPLFKQKIAYGSKGFPWTINKHAKKIKYTNGICPVADDLQDNKYLGILLCSYVYDKQDVNNLIKAFHKVWNKLESLK